MFLFAPTRPGFCDEELEHPPTCECKVVHDFPEAANLAAWSFVNSNNPLWGSGKLNTCLRSSSNVIRGLANDAVGYVGLTSTLGGQTDYGWSSARGTGGSATPFIQ